MSVKTPRVRLQKVNVPLSLPRHNAFTLNP
jgi:hypothetical protein